MERQKQVLEMYCAAQGWTFEVVADVGSGMNYHKSGTKQESMPLSVREWTCLACGTHYDRDLNGAINLRNWAVSFTVAACGEDIRPDITEVASTSRNPTSKLPMRRFE
ncbi:transposase [Alicyclobacillus sp. ALC3]|nr:transposase [Alicyclobacillus sp. ALC3]